ncbi:MAG: diguanylate cyclase, partial [Sulfurihydrogenibium azorense]|uniref:diguanylate cyclase n=1 Tax=Sulfurihydrogenibium azorense TaxID=309806 RepID=UPI003919B3AF
KMPYKLLERFKERVRKEVWEEKIKDFYTKIPNIISEIETFYDRSISISILTEDDKLYLKRFVKRYIKNYLLKYPDEKYVLNLYNAGKRLFLKGYTDEILLEVYKIVYKSVEEDSLLKEKINFDFLVVLRPYMNYSLDEEKKLLKDSNVEMVFSLQEAAKIHIKNKNKFLKAVADGDTDVLSNIPDYENCEFTKWLEEHGRKVLNEESYKEVWYFHKLFHEKFEKIKHIYSKNKENNSLAVYLLLKDIENTSLKLLFILNRISLDNISKIALKDSLTGFLNRHMLDVILSKEISRSKRYGYKISILMMDLDNFKKINDTYGHLVGDEILMHFARIVKNNLRESDYPFRYGGEEFLILLPHTDEEGALVVAERIRKSVESYKFPVIERITVSCGVREIKNLDNPYIDIEEADRYLYIAKKTGKNRCVYGSTAFTS